MTDEKFMSAFGLEIYTDDQKTCADDIISKQDKAKEKASEMGSEYEVRYGDNQEGTDNFIWMDESEGPS